MELQFIKKYNSRVYEGTIYFEITFKKKKKKKKKKRVNVIHIRKKEKSRTQRKSIINKRKEKKKELAKDRTWKFVEASDSKYL